MDTNQYILWRPYENRTISRVNVTISSSSRKKGTKECKGSLSRGETSLQVIYKTWKEFHSSIMRYGCANISLYQTTSSKIRLKIN